MKSNPAIASEYAFLTLSCVPWKRMVVLPSSDIIMGGQGHSWSGHIELAVCRGREMSQAKCFHNLKKHYNSGDVWVRVPHRTYRIAANIVSPVRRIE